MAEYITFDTELSSIANAIRIKGGTSNTLTFPDGYITAIGNINTGADVSNVTATAADVLPGKYFYTSAGIRTQGTIAFQEAQTITPGTTDQTISSGKYLSGSQTILGDANLVAGNIKKNVQIFGITGTYDGIEVEDAFITRTITTYTNSTVTTLRSFAFAYCYNLTSVNFLACNQIYGRAFYSCSALETANFPACTSLDPDAFYYCYSLKTVNFPSCTFIGASAFCYCGLMAVDFPACLSVASWAFQGCYKLSVASFPTCTTIYSNAFYNCQRLLSLYLMGSSIANLVSSNAFANTPINGYTNYTSGIYGSIYVPLSLLDTYKSANRWSYYSNRFVGI